MGKGQQLYTETTRNYPTLLTKEHQGTPRNATLLTHYASAHIQCTIQSLGKRPDQITSCCLVTCISDIKTTLFLLFSIGKEHAVITVKDSEITIKPAVPGSKTKVNGMPLTGETPLKHMDRLLFGK